MATVSNPDPLLPLPLPPPPSTVAPRPRRGARQVSSRYLSTPRNPSPSPRSVSNPSPRRTPSRSGSCYGSESESESADENRVPTPGTGSRSSNGTFYFTSQPNRTSKRVVHKLFDEKTDPGSRLPEESKRRPRPPGTPISPNLARLPVKPKRDATLLRPIRSEEDNSFGSQNGSLCESPPIGTNLRNRTGSATDLRSSFSGTDSSLRSSNPLVCRSLNSSLALGVEFGNKNTPTETKRRVSTDKPPQPPGLRAGIDLKKVKKGKKGEEDVHYLKLLHNRHLQLRFMNAKAEVAANGRKKSMEKELYGASLEISKRRDQVNEKRIQLDSLKREILLDSILEFQKPYLEDWDNIKEDQSECLSGILVALQNASIRVPVDADVKVNAKEIESALIDAMNFLEPLHSLQNFVPKAEEIENIASDLAKVTVDESELIEECGNLLAFARDLQVRESSLRSSLIQKKQQKQIDLKSG